MTSEQLSAITAMQLMQEDWQTWMQEQGVRVGVGGEPGQMGAGQNLSEEEWAERMAELGITGGGNPGEMSEEDRAAMRATMEASGVVSAGDGAGARPGQTNMLPSPLIELLNQRAAE